VTLVERHAALVKDAREAAQALEAAKERFHVLRGAVAVVEQQMREEIQAVPPATPLSEVPHMPALSMLDD